MCLRVGRDSDGGVYCEDIEQGERSNRDEGRKERKHDSSLRCETLDVQGLGIPSVSHPKDSPLTMLGAMVESGGV